MRADEILHLLHTRKHRTDQWFTEVKNGPSTLTRTVRLDALAIKPSWTQPLFSGYEVKVSRSDFLRDDKWLAYLPMCHRLSFACPDGLIQADELPTDVGLYWINEAGRLKAVRRPVTRPLPALPVDMLYYILVSRSESDRHPFFTSHREYFAAWVQEKAADRRLGHQVQSKMAITIRDLQAGWDRRERRMERAQEETQALHRTLEAAGLPTNEWDLRRALHQLGNGYPALWDQMVQAVEHLARMVEHEKQRQSKPDAIGGSIE